MPKPMNRRTFLKTSTLTTLAAVSGAALPLRALAAAEGGINPGGFNPSPANGWRIFEVTTRVEPKLTQGMMPGSTPGAIRVWVPLPSVSDPVWIRPLGNSFLGNATTVTTAREGHYGAQMAAARWEADEAAPVLEVTSRFATRDRVVDLGKPGRVAPLDKASRRLFTQATDLLPVDGIVGKTAQEITRGAKTDLDKARAIYEWIVDNTQRNPQTRGCGTGDIRGMLESGNLSGKCADLNALYVGLARSAGLPARDVYGIRVADSRFGYKSLGKSGDISKAQHCRAEVWLANFGWVPVDPADVRKVVLEERPGLTLQDDVVVQARSKLFGAWEMNWLAYNVAHDIVMPGSKGGKLPFLMYPQGENAAGRFDSLDPVSFSYRITSKEVSA